MADQPQQQPQVTPEMLKKLQGEKEEKTKAKPSFGGSGSRHWIVKFIKDIFYISFFPYLWLKEFFNWLFANKQEKLKQSVNINKVDNPNPEISNDTINNKKGQISLQEIESSTSDISLAEIVPEATSSSNNDTSQTLRNNRWNQTMANNCAHQEPKPPVGTTPKNGLTS